MEAECGQIKIGVVALDQNKEVQYDATEVVRSMARRELMPCSMARQTELELDSIG